MIISHIDSGLSNDDFLHDRVTLRVITEEGIYVFKRYRDGRLTDYIDARYEGGEYIEKDLSEEDQKAVNDYLEKVASPQSL